jgi:hypothetical protein
MPRVAALIESLVTWYGPWHALNLKEAAGDEGGKEKSVDGEEMK